MVISVTRARKLMSKEANEMYSDDQVAEVINVFTILSDLIIDNYVEKHKVQTKQEGGEKENGN